MKVIKILLACIFISICIFSLQARKLPELIPYNKNGLWGFSDSLQNIIIPCKYDEVNFFNNGFAIVSGDCKMVYPYGNDVGGNKVCKQGVIDSKGNLIIPIEYNRIENFNEMGIAKAYRNEKVGFIDKTGKEIMPFIYKEKGFKLDKNLSIIFLDKKVGLLNDDIRKIVVPVKYDTIIHPLNQINRREYSVIWVGNNEKWGFYNPKNNILVEPQFDKFVEYRVFNRRRTMGETERFLYTETANELAIWDKMTGKKIISGKYNEIQPFLVNKLKFYKTTIKDTSQSVFLQLRIDNKWGVSDSIGKIIIPIRYDNITLIDDYFQATEDKNIFFFNLSGNKINKKFELSEKFAKLNLTKIQRSGKWGVLDSVGNEIIPCQYDTLIHQRNIDAIIAVKDNKYGLFNKQGEEIAPCVYDPIKDYYSDSYGSKQTFVVRQNEKCGLINCELRQEVIPCKYEYIEMFHPHKNLYIVSSLSGLGYSDYYRKGLIDDKGKVILLCEYQEIFAAKSNIVLVKQNGLLGFMDVTNGQWLIPIKYQSAMTYHINPFILKLNDKWGLVDSTHNRLTSFKFDRIESNDFVNKDFAQTKIGSQYGIINRKGEEIVPCIYDEVKSIYSLFFVRKGNKWGIINQTGIQLKNCIYDDFEGEYWFNKRKWTAIKENGKWGLMNGEGEIMVKPQYQSIEKNYNDLVINVSQDARWGVVDSIGKKIIPCQYDKVKSINKNFIAVQTNGLWGIVDFTNREIVSCQYGNIEVSGVNLNDNNLSENNKSDFIKIRKNGRWGLLSKDGKQEIIPCQYDAIVILSEDLYIACNDYTDEFYNSKGVKIASLHISEERDFDYNYDYYLLKYTKNSLIKTDFGYIDLKGNTYFEYKSNY